MKKTKLTRSLLAACSIVALSAVMYGCVGGGDDPVAKPPPIDMDGDGDGDGDGVADADDAFPNDPMETADADGDGVGDNADLDDDNDGVADVHDGLPLNPMETKDTDGDGVGDNADLDDDGDGVTDAEDAFPNDAMETADSDGDGVGDNADAFDDDPTETADSDGDGVGDNADAFPMNAMETADSDMDGTGDNADAFPMDAMETADSDMDGTGDNADAFPMNAMETADSDMDGTGDNADAFPMDATETADSDMDGTGDNADAFPMDAAETMDADMDGTGDNADAFPMDAAETMDSDMDGTGDNADAFPMDAAETMDSDMDGVGDNADWRPMDAAESADTDGDGVGDNADTFDDDPTEWADADGDGRGDNMYPPDRDGDGVADVADRFPDDPMESQDSDEDGVGNNADAFPFDGTETADADMDGVGDNADADDNNDGINDVFEGNSGLILMAKAQHITASDVDLPDTPLNESVTDANEAQDQAREDHVASVNTAVAAANGDSDDPSHGGGEVTATYPYFSDLGDDDALGGTEGNADTGPGEGKPAISVDPGGEGGAAVALRHAGPGADADDPEDDLTDNFAQGPGRGDFVHEKYISGLDTGTADDLNDHNNQRVILFTDLKQANAPADAVTVTLVNVPVTASRIDTLGMAINDSRDYENGEYDHDGNPDTDLVTGEFLCPDPSACSITVQGGEVTSISGYRFTSEADEIIVPAVVSTEDTTWLAFGVWLTEMVVEDGTNTYDFGAFADGGNAVANADSIGGVTGDATYRGKAAGVHSTADAVDFFHADATLTAEFGDGTANGTITGSIHDIVAAGRFRHWQHRPGGGRSGRGCPGAQHRRRRLVRWPGPDARYGRR